MLKAAKYEREGARAGARLFATVELASDERHLRRKVLVLSNGEKLLVELERATAFSQDDVLIADSGERIGIVAAIEPLYEVKAKNALHHAQLCWHLGNRHLPAQIELDRIFILRDHVICDMLEGLGASLSETEGRFSPVRGAYHKTSGGHSHDHEHDHHHGDSHGAGHGHAH
ncbi:urease accessory protein UreE [Rhodobacteraceae bacterium RKSG542]|uniref:urease accessory protein UreE n=1 Tax=Pseudovibrio flavus TaxID=2529854 RepID=UPI0012BC3F09|nr:urease accessory protein UreE [Pseudovibrio flavus]MTI17943.1 urease accessory protein UreE [Pseudovibrio flavus]